MIKSAIVTLAFATATVGALAQDNDTATQEPQAAEVAPAADSAEPPKVVISLAGADEGEEICKRFREIGSRIAHRKVCKTQAEWDKDRESNADALRNPRGAGGPQLGNGG